jgi:hypothetical protein
MNYPAFTTAGFSVVLFSSAAYVLWKRFGNGGKAEAVEVEHEGKKENHGTISNDDKAMIPQVQSDQIDPKVELESELQPPSPESEASSNSFEYQDIFGSKDVDIDFPTMLLPDSERNKIKMNMNEVNEQEASNLALSETISEIVELSLMKSNELDENDTLHSVASNLEKTEKKQVMTPLKHELQRIQDTFEHLILQNSLEGETDPVPYTIRTTDPDRLPFSSFKKQYSPSSNELLNHRKFTFPVVADIIHEKETLQVKKEEEEKEEIKLREEEEAFQLLFTPEFNRMISPIKLSHDHDNDNDDNKKKTYNDEDDQQPNHNNNNSLDSSSSFSGNFLVLSYPPSLSGASSPVEDIQQEIIEGKDDYRETEPEQPCPEPQKTEHQIVEIHKPSDTEEQEQEQLLPPVTLFSEEPQVAVAVVDQKSNEPKPKTVVADSELQLSDEDDINDKEDDFDEEEGYDFYPGSSLNRSSMQNNSNISDLLANMKEILTVADMFPPSPDTNGQQRDLIPAMNLPPESLLFDYSLNYSTDLFMESPKQQKPSKQNQPQQQDAKEKSIIFLGISVVNNRNKETEVEEKEITRNESKDQMDPSPTVTQETGEPNKKRKYLFQRRPKKETVVKVSIESKEEVTKTINEEEFLSPLEVEKPFFENPFLEELKKMKTPTDQGNEQEEVGEKTKEIIGKSKSKDSQHNYHFEDTDDALSEISDMSDDNHKPRHRSRPHRSEHILPDTLVNHDIIRKLMDVSLTHRIERNSSPNANSSSGGIAIPYYSTSMNGGEDKNESSKNEYALSLSPSRSRSPAAITKGITGSSNNSGGQQRKYKSSPVTFHGSSGNFPMTTHSEEVFQRLYERPKKHQQYFPPHERKDNKEEVTRRSSPQNEISPSKGLQDRPAFNLSNIKRIDYQDASMIFKELNGKQKEKRKKKEKRTPEKTDETPTKTDRQEQSETSSALIPPATVVIRRPSLTLVSSPALQASSSPSTHSMIILNLETVMQSHKLKSFQELIQRSSSKDRKQHQQLLQLFEESQEDRLSCLLNYLSNCVHIIIRKLLENSQIYFCLMILYKKKDDQQNGGDFGEEETKNSNNSTARPEKEEQEYSKKYCYYHYQKKKLMISSHFHYFYIPDDLADSFSDPQTVLPLKEGEGRKKGKIKTDEPDEDGSLCHQQRIIQNYILQAFLKDELRVMKELLSIHFRSMLMHFIDSYYSSAVLQSPSSLLQEFGSYYRQPVVKLDRPVGNDNNKNSCNMDSLYHQISHSQIHNLLSIIKVSCSFYPDIIS